MIDNREETAWYSRNVAEAEVTLTLNSATQVKTTIGHISVIQNKKHNLFTNNYLRCLCQCISLLVCLISGITVLPFLQKTEY